MFFLRGMPIKIKRSYIGTVIMPFNEEVVLGLSGLVQLFTNKFRLLRIKPLIDIKLVGDSNLVRSDRDRFEVLQPCRRADHGSQHKCPFFSHLVFLFALPETRSSPNQSCLVGPAAEAGALVNTGAVGSRLTQSAAPPSSVSV